MEETPSSFPMKKTGKIFRTSIFIFLQNYQYFTSFAALLALPFAASILLSQAFIPSTSFLLPTIYNRLQILFDAAGFPPSSEFFTILNLKLSQTITSSLFTLPFTITFLLLAKTSIVHVFINQKPVFPSSFISMITLYNPLLHTYIWNSFLLLSANATAFSILFFAFNCLQGFGFSSPSFLLFLSATGAVIYSIILANALIICNLSLILSGMERCGGYLAILKACVLIRGRTSTALSLALPMNLAMAATEALFQYRVVKASNAASNLSPTMAIEGLFIVYLYSILIVLDTIVSCKFFKSCKARYASDHECSRYSYMIQIGEEQTDVHPTWKTSEFPSVAL